MHSYNITQEYPHNSLRVNEIADKLIKKQQQSRSYSLNPKRKTSILDNEHPLDLSLKKTTEIAGKINHLPDLKKRKMYSFDPSLRSGNSTKKSDGIISQYKDGFLLNNNHDSDEPKQQNPSESKTLNTEQDKRKAYQKTYQKTYKQSEKYKAYKQSEKYKAYQKAYQKEYRQSERYKAYQNAYRDIISTTGDIEQAKIAGKNASSAVLSQSKK
ncbi:hypothetical protein [Endozoicomonas ascidiicola]|uniref:hypothetical protein n=1 Tax=Endozoicomonas ascidiicola TaxID=1698521 RepID=UPI000832B4BE|nr:hypothetical protein [Endozoicomonas ascidiicola]